MALTYVRSQTFLRSIIFEKGVRKKFPSDSFERQTRRFFQSVNVINNTFTVNRNCRNEWHLFNFFQKSKYVFIIMDKTAFNLRS